MAAESLLTHSPAAADTRIATLVRTGLTPIVVGTALGVGYGNIGGALGEAAFVTRYHHPSDALLQALAAAMQAGCVIGSLFAGWLADTHGRRRTILLALLLVMASGAVLLVPALAPRTDSSLLRSSSAACCSASAAALRVRLCPST